MMTSLEPMQNKVAYFKSWFFPWKVNYLIENAFVMVLLKCFRPIAKPIKYVFISDLHGYMRTLLFHSVFDFTIHKWKQFSFIGPTMCQKERARYYTYCCVSLMAFWASRFRVQCPLFMLKCSKNNLPCEHCINGKLIKW